MSFESFWKQYPRKMAKVVAARAWTKLSTDQQDDALKALPKHIEYWNLHTEKQFIPFPATWLNQQRFYDEIEEPEEKRLQLVAWWTSDAGILDKGRELGIEPRPGETMYQFKDRVSNKVKAA